MYVPRCDVRIKLI